MAKKRKPEDVQNYIDIYETLRKAVPDGANVLAVLRAAEFLLADCIASADVSDEVLEQTCAAIDDDIRNFVKAFRNKGLIFLPNNEFYGLNGFINEHECE